MKSAAMEPLISIQLFDHLPAYPPGGRLKCDYQIDAVPEKAITVVEASVLWYTEGKGDEDLGVHFFERRTAAEEEEDLRVLRRFECDLPMSPLSYAGEIVQVNWCVRVRVFLKSGGDASLDYAFFLGAAPPDPASPDSTELDDPTPAPLPDEPHERT
ncbi:MAG: hypothetical protein AAGF97_03780 [Planctomycetota bacterium]